MKNQISLEDGKYLFYKVDGLLKCQRYREDWREFLGDHAVTALFDYAAEMTYGEVIELTRPDLELITKALKTRIEIFEFEPMTNQDKVLAAQNRALLSRLLTARTIVIKD